MIKLLGYNMFSKIKFLRNNLEFHVGLRTRNKTKDPNNKIWFFGCSHVFGSGVLAEETAPHQLSQILNTEVINYGVPGSGPMMVEEQLNDLLIRYTPKFVIIAWPNLSRWQSKEPLIPFSVLWGPWVLESNYKTSLDHFGSKKIFPKTWKKYVDLLDTGSVNSINLNTISRVRDKLKNIPNIEFTYNYDDKLDIHKPLWKDKGTTGMHPGPVTHKETAEWLANEIQLLL